MKHLLSNKTGQLAEENLFSLLKDKRNKRVYVASTLSKFNFIMNQIVRATYNNKTLTKYLLGIHFKEAREQIGTSSLEDSELTHLDNALHTRYLKKIRELKIPMN